MPKPLPRIEAANALDLASFKDRYFTNPEIPPIATHSGRSESYAVFLETSSTISPADFDACFALVAVTSSHDYANSSIKWSPAKKRREMRLPDLRYILLKQDPSSPPVGFLSFMLTYEDGLEVIYCYEIHLVANLRKHGLGARLIHSTEGVGCRVGVEKLMLTVFVANRGALAFYNRLGYGIDECSPEPKVLRGRIKKEVDYLILSKNLSNDKAQEELEA